MILEFENEDALKAKILIGMLKWESSRLQAIAAALSDYELENMSGIVYGAINAIDDTLKFLSSVLKEKNVEVR